MSIIYQSDSGTDILFKLSQYYRNAEIKWKPETWDRFVTRSRHGDMLCFNLQAVTDRSQFNKSPEIPRDLENYEGLKIIGKQAINFVNWVKFAHLTIL